jgi:hypothetical protein
VKKTLIALAVLAAGLAGQAHAALVDVPFQYRLTFVDPTVAGELAFAPSGRFSGTVTFDDATAPDALGLYDATALTLGFGSFNLTQDDNISPFPVGVAVGPNKHLTALFFEAGLTLTQAPGAGDYLLSFFGTDAQLTPSGNTSDFKVTALAVPEPGTLPLVLAGLAAVGLVARRRRKQPD